MLAQQLLENFVCPAGTAFLRSTPGLFSSLSVQHVLIYQGPELQGPRAAIASACQPQWTAAAQRHETRTMADNFVTVEPTELKFR